MVSSLILPFTVRWHYHLTLSWSSPEDIAITTKIVQTAEIIGIQVHEHLIISMSSDRYYSFADNGIIKKMQDEIS